MIPANGEHYRPKKPSVDAVRIEIISVVKPKPNYLMTLVMRRYLSGEQIDD